MHHLIAQGTLSRYHPNGAAGQWSDIRVKYTFQDTNINVIVIVPEEEHEVGEESMEVNARGSNG